MKLSAFQNHQSLFFLKIPTKLSPTACSTFDRLIMEIPTKRKKKIEVESKRSHFELFNIKMNKGRTSQGDLGPKRRAE